MTVELRWQRATGVCCCGQVVDADTPIECRHYLECDWGTFGNSDADPRREIEHLILVRGDYFAELLRDGPRRSPRSYGYDATHSATLDCGRKFLHVEHGGKRWTWELFDAQFAHRPDITGMLVGRWPD